MPVYTKIDGEMMESFSEDAKLVAVTESSFHRELGAVESDARMLTEMNLSVTEDGDTYNIDAELREQINNTMSALTDLYASLPMPKVRAAA